MPRVMHIADRLSAWGGADRHLIAILGLLQGRAQTLLAVGRDDGSLPPSERAAIGPVIRVKGLDRGGLSQRGGAAATGRLAQAIAAFAPDVVHLHNLMDPDLLTLAAQAAPCLATVQDHRPFCPGRGKLTADGRICGRVMGPGCLACFNDPDYGRRLLALTGRRLAALGRMRRVLVLSEYMAGQLAQAGLPAGLVEVLPPLVQGIEAPASDGPGLHHLLACRLVGRKGVAVALEAAQRLTGPWPLVVAGTGPLADACRQRAEASGGRLRFVGWADREGMSRLLAQARSLWLPSLWAEPFGIVGLEALHLGVPVLASRVGGVADWLTDGQGGHLLPPGDAAALAAAANQLDGDEAARLALGQAGQAISRRRFEPRRLMDRLLAVYERVAAQAG